MLNYEQNRKCLPYTVHFFHIVSVYLWYIDTMNDISVFNYLDYRPFLRDAFSALKGSDPDFNYRAIASQLGFGSIGHITWILQGKRNLTVSNAPKFSELLKLNKREDAFFQLLVLYTNSKKHGEKRDLFERIVAIQKSDHRVVSREQMEYWSRWYYSALREVVAIHRIKDDYKSIAKFLVPRITPAEAEKALKLLEKLGFIVQDKQGVFRRVDKVIGMNAEFGPLAVRQHQMDMLELAKQGLEYIAREERDISSLTMSLSIERFKQVKEMFQEFRQQLITLARTDPHPQQVFQVGLQIFPLSTASGGTDEKE